MAYTDRILRKTIIILLKSLPDLVFHSSKTLVIGRNLINKTVCVKRIPLVYAFASLTTFRPRMERYKNGTVLSTEIQLSGVLSTVGAKQLEESSNKS